MRVAPRLVASCRLDYDPDVSPRHDTTRQVRSDQSNFRMHQRDFDILARESAWSMCQVRRGTGTWREIKLARQTHRAVPRRVVQLCDVVWTYLEARQGLVSDHQIAWLLRMSVTQDKRRRRISSGWRYYAFQKLGTLNCNAWKAIHAATQRISTWRNATRDRALSLKACSHFISPAVSFDVLVLNGKLKLFILSAYPRLLPTFFANHD